MGDPRFELFLGRVEHPTKAPAARPRNRSLPREGVPSSSPGFVIGVVGDGSSPLPVTIWMGCSISEASWLRTEALSSSAERHSTPT